MRSIIILLVASIVSYRCCGKYYVITFRSLDTDQILLNMVVNPADCCIYVLCIVITYTKGKDQPGKVVNPSRGQLNKEY